MPLSLGEIRSAARRLARTPGWTAAVLLTLGIGIGGNVEVFRRLEAALLRPLPYPEPDRLLMLWEGRPEAGQSRFGVSAPMFHDWRREISTLEHVTAFIEEEANFAGGEQPARIRVLRATSDLLPALGAAPLIGRGTSATDEAEGAAVCVLTEPFWRGAFAADPGVLGRQVRVGDERLTIVGVVPASVRELFDDPALVRPLALAGDDRRGARWLTVLARLAPGASHAAARAELEALALRLERERPDQHRGWRAETAAVSALGFERARGQLVPLAVSVGLVMFLACVHVAHLFLVRTLARQRETAIRLTIGAGGWQLARPILLESLLVSLGGGALGCLLAAVAGVLSGPVAGDGSTPGVVPGPRALLFAAGVACLSAAAISLLPLLTMRRARAALLRGTGGDVGLPGRRRTRRLLIVLEIAAAFVLLASAGVLARSVQGLLRVDPGFRTEGVLTARLAPPFTAAGDLAGDELMRLYRSDRARAASFFARLQERLAARPGVGGVAAVNRLPMTGNWWTIGYAVEGAPPPSPGESLSAFGRVVTPGYFATLGIPLQRGRDFAPGDDGSSLPVVVVDAELARRHFAGRDPIGAVLRLDEQVSATIVGVVGGVRLSGLDRPAPPTFYVPMSQAMFGFYPDWGMDVVISGSGDATALVAALQEEVARLDPGLPVFATRTLDEVLHRTLRARRGVLSALGGFSVMALLLAGIGLYGVLAQIGRERLRELALRMALGAQGGRLGWSVIVEGLGLGAAGIVLGAAGSAAAGLALGRLLFDVRPADPVVSALIALLLAAVSALAAWAPARRAMRVDPARVLRGD